MKKLICVLAIVLMATVASAASITLEWVASADPEVTGYKIYGDISDPAISDNPTVIDVGNVLEYTVTGLTAGTTYYFRNKAYSPSGESDWSNGTFGEPELLPATEFLVK